MQPMSDSRLRQHAAIEMSVGNIGEMRVRATGTRMARRWALHSWLALACGAFPAACASAPPARPETPRAMSPSEEAEAIEAAKRHPIALTYERPRDPQAVPVRPVPIPAEVPPPAPPATVPAPPVAEAPAAPTPPAPAAPRDQVVIVGQDTPSPSTTTTYMWPEPDRPDDGYVWVDGGWVARPRVRAQVDVYPSWHYHRPWVYPPAVVVVPEHRHWHGHHHHSPRVRYHSAPPARRYHVHPSRPVYVAPPARGDRPSVRSAPPARSRGHVHSAPPSRRQVRVR